ncbi:putative alpha,alpha-trehalose-phosphate synthase [UDP-forming] 8 [Wolffia australiana]
MPSSQSCANLLELATRSADLPSPGRPRTPLLPRVVTVPGVISDFGDDDQALGSCDRVLPDCTCDSPAPRERRIIVAHQLPIRSQRDESTRRWRFSWDPDALPLQLRAGLPPNCETLFVGTVHPPSSSPDSSIDPSEEDDVKQTLFDQFRCVPVFLPFDTHHRFYHGFCKHYLWPLFHYMLPVSPSGLRFDRSLWLAYVSANRAFGDAVTEALNSDDDKVWVHDYHLLLLPTFLRRRSYRAKIGFFLHSPFPSSDVYRTLPVRDEILRALLNADLVGFHTFDYARHFLSCCSRMLGIDYESKRGYIGLEYYGRTVGIKILPLGVDMGQLEAAMRSPAAEAMTRQLIEQYSGKIVILGVDDMDLFKGISLKFLAMGQLLEDHPEYRGRVVLIQIANPARSQGDDVREVHREMLSVAGKINARFGAGEYQPIVVINRAVPTFEKVAFYAIAECCVVNAVRDGMNLVPYKYTVSRQWSPALGGEEKKSVIVVSEFIGCSPSLSGAIRVNPWNVDAVAEAMNQAIKMPEPEKRLRHEKHFKYVTSHDVGYWARSFDQDLQRACKYYQSKRCWGIGFGLFFRVVALDPNFRKLSAECVVANYAATSRRLILLDYDGTMMPQACENKSPSEQVISVLNSLCADRDNVVFVVSGRGKDSLSRWFRPVRDLGISAEHGYLTRWSGEGEWEKGLATGDFDWKKMAEPVMRLYMEATDGSSMEQKESALVWHHQDADPEFGTSQAKELLDHLESVLANEPVVVKRGQHIVEVKPQGVSKGKVVEGLIERMGARGQAPDFVLCVGDDRSDEDMFESIVAGAGLPAGARVFACTVGKKPSRARYYLDDTSEVMRMLVALAAASDRRQKPPAPATGGAPLMVDFKV